MDNTRPPTAEEYVREHSITLPEMRDELDLAAERQEALERLRTTSDLPSGGNAENGDPDPDVTAALADLAEAQQKLLDERDPVMQTLSDSMPEPEDDDTDGGIFSRRFKEKCRQLLAARDAYAEADARRKAAKKELDEIELDVFELFEGMAAEGDKSSASLPVPLGEPYGVVKFRTRETHYAKIADEDALMEWLENRAMVDEVSGPSFVKRRLHEMVRTALENRENLPAGLTYYTDRGMTVTRQK